MLAKRQHAKRWPDQNDRGNHRAFKQRFVEFEATQKPGRAKKGKGERRHAAAARPWAAGKDRELAFLGQIDRNQHRENGGAADLKNRSAASSGKGVQSKDKQAQKVRNSAAQPTGERRRRAASGRYAGARPAWRRSRSKSRRRAEEHRSRRAKRSPCMARRRIKQSGQDESGLSPRPRLAGHLMVRRRTWPPLHEKARMARIRSISIPVRLYAATALRNSSVHERKTK